MNEDWCCALDVPYPDNPVGAVDGVRVVVDSVRVSGVEDGAVVPAVGALGTPVDDGRLEVEEGGDYGCGVSKGAILDGGAELAELGNRI